MPKLRIDEVYDGDDGPIIINFQNGYANESIETSESCLLKNLKNGKETVALASDNLIYTGEVTTEDLYDTFLLTRNKETGKVRLIKVRSANVKPILDRPKRTAELLDTSALELSRAFGSKKQKRRMEQREKLKIDETTVTKQMKNSAANTTLQAVKDDLTDYSIDSVAFYIPPMNREATDLSKVYDIDKILTPEQFDKIASEIQDKNLKSDLNKFTKNIVSTQKLGKKETILAIYASALISLYKAIMKDICKRTYEVCKTSSTLNEIVLRNFLTLVNNRRYRPPMYKDKALCHAIVMLLIINNYSVDQEALASELGITGTTLAQKAKVAGATVITIAKRKVIQLKFPLMSAGKVFNRRKSTPY